MYFLILDSLRHYIYVYRIKCICIAKYNFYKQNLPIQSLASKSPLNISGLAATAPLDFFFFFLGAAASPSVGASSGLALSSSFLPLLDYINFIKLNLLIFVFFC